ncbi:TPA: hypothetical protein I7686_20315 [Vibrio vulnificus]|nr:hypothetical protein [Vibrio vulnificus]
MGPRVREDDKNKKRKNRVKFSGKEQKTLHTTTLPAVIPVHTGNHLSAHAGCRVWKRTRHNRQQEQRQYSSNTNPQRSPYHGSPRSRG